MDYSLQMVDRSYLYCYMNSGFDLSNTANNSYFTFVSQFNRGESSSLLAGVEATLLVLFFLLSTAFNVFLFYTLCSNHHMRVVTSYFMRNLTLADICFTLPCPLVAFVRVTGSWTLGSIACKTFVFISSVGMFVIIWTLVLISVDRFRCIVQFTSRRISPRLALLLIANLWILTAVAFCPILIFISTKECPCDDGTVTICTVTSPINFGIYALIVCFLGFAVPSVIVVYTHGAIFLKVHKSQRTIAAQRNNTFGGGHARLPANSSWRCNQGRTVSTATNTTRTCNSKENIATHPRKVSRTSVYLGSSVSGLTTWAATEAAQPSCNYDDQRQQRPGGVDSSALEVAAVSSDPDVNQQQQKVVAFRRFTNTGSDIETISADEPHQNHHQLLYVDSSRRSSRPEEGESPLMGHRQRLDVKLSNKSPTTMSDRKQTTTDVVTTLNNVHGSSADVARNLATAGVASKWAIVRKSISLLIVPGDKQTEDPGNKRASISRPWKSKPSPFPGVQIFRTSYGISLVSTKSNWRNRMKLGTRTTLVLMVLLFIALWAPMFVVLMLIHRDIYLDVKEVTSQIFLGAMCAAYSNAVLNPLMHGLTSGTLVKRR